MFNNTQDKTTVVQSSSIVPQQSLHSVLHKVHGGHFAIEREERKGDFEGCVLLLLLECSSLPTCFCCCGMCLLPSSSMAQRDLEWRLMEQQALGQYWKLRDFGSHCSRLKSFFFSPKSVPSLVPKILFFPSSQWGCSDHRLHSICKFHSGRSWFHHDEAGATGRELGWASQVPTSWQGGIFWLSFFSPRKKKKGKPMVTSF